MKSQYVCNVINEEPLVPPVMKFDKPTPTKQDKQDSEQRTEGTARHTEEEPLTIPTMNFREKE
jgi:hypothetical protein